MTSANPFPPSFAALFVAATIGQAFLACGDSRLAGTSGEPDSVSVDTLSDIVTDSSSDSASDDDAVADADVDDEPDIQVPIPDADGSADTAADAGEDAGPDDEVVFCGEDEDCPSALCYLPSSSPDLGVCTTLCAGDENCPADWNCVQDQNAGGDAVRICVPTDLCIDADEDGAGYGPGCTATDCDELDPRIYVGASEVCDGADNDCDGDIDEDPIDENDDCSTGFEGVCASGRTRCIEGLLECVADRSASDEVCDGLDNDCDGAVDENVDGDPLTRPCYGGPEGTADVGLCAQGTATCEAGLYDGCEGAVLPALEVCDGLDNDCDGTADEDEPGAGEICSTGLGGACDTSTTVCVDGALLCPPSTEGRIEICDGVDNDCDGEIDEDNPGGGGACGSGLLGVCAAGIRACEAGTLVCNPAVAPSEETCDGLDNDCDGTADEGNPDGGGDCTSDGLGVCQAGRLVCAAGALECQSLAAPSAELCDGIDNDCDGQTDEGNPGSGLTCSTGESGLCGNGVTACTDGAIVCTTTISPTTELCNGLDDDCDGTVDNGDPGGGRACGTGNPGICSAGITACSGGGIVCEQTAAPSTEVCDGLDNNCNGATDEGNPGGGLSCSTGQAGICAAGTTACANGSVVCNRNNAPVSEICDSLDNDCDGSTNEQCPNGYRAGTGTTSPQWADLDGGSFFASTCPAGTYAAGFYGRAAARMDQVGTRCATMSFNANTGTNPWSYTLDRGALSSATAYGGGGGSAITRDCAAGTFMIGLAGRAGDRMDQMQALCGRFAITGSPGSYTVTRTQTTSTATAGGSGGSPFSYLCPNNGVVAYIQGRSGSEVDSAYVRCTELVPTLIAP